VLGEPQTRRVAIAAHGGVGESLALPGFDILATCDSNKGTQQQKAAKMLETTIHR
jgi:hypothetical protein